ncbi:MAG: glycine cleavage T C-terminal barrel domain-containing protein [Xanthomonadales bacterium]|nr:glycine cleavage T C-terminal barrel domain-containing protein [Xanthomonadales bacterium]
MHFDKPHFTGRQALAREKQNGSRYVLARLDIDGNKPAHQSFIFDKRQKFAGTVTSATWSPSAKRNIALASLVAPHGAPGEELLAEIYYQRELKWSRVMAPCRVVEGVFWDPPRKRQTPPADF